MEIIKKKVCLEQFRSRIPALIHTVEGEKYGYFPKDGSWGRIPKPIAFLGKEIKYGTLIGLYYSALKMLMNASFLEYDESGKKWIEKDYDWRHFIINGSESMKDVTFVTEIPSVDLKDKMIITLVTQDEVNFFYNEINDIFGGSNNGITLINEFHRVIGKKIVPPEDTDLDDIDTEESLAVYNGMYVPYFVYLADVPDLIAFMEELQEKAETTCCERERYEEYGGNEFLQYLKNLEIPSAQPYTLTGTTTLDIPVLLTSTVRNFGQYKLYDVEEVVDGEVVKDEYDKQEKTSSILITGMTGESKLRTLRKRKRSFDDNGFELPGIFNIDSTVLENPYQVGYIKNIQMSGNSFYGDTIESMIEIVNTDENGTKSYEVEISYVLGGRLRKNGDKMTLDESSPFEIGEESYDSWDGEGIWYKERYPLIKSTGIFKINDQEKEYSYTQIDFASKEMVYEYDGIDFPRKNYILCEEIRYKSDSYKKNCTFEPIFYDEKMTGLSGNIKETYDIVIDRGSSSAFDKHLQLMEIKTWDDLEKYRNGMFLNK